MNRLRSSSGCQNLIINVMNKGSSNELRGDSKQAGPPIVEELPKFKNCRVARLTNGVVRRISNVTTEIPSESDIAEEQSYEHELPPGVDVENLQREIPKDAQTNSEIPKMVCSDEQMGQRIKSLCLEFEHIFSRQMQPQAAKIAPMSLDMIRRNG